MLSEYLNVRSSYDLLPPIPRGSAYISLPLCGVGGEEVGSGAPPDCLFFWNFASVLSSCQTGSRIELKVTAIYCCSLWQNPLLNVGGVGRVAPFDVKK